MDTYSTKHGIIIFKIRWLQILITLLCIGLCNFTLRSYLGDPWTRTWSDLKIVLAGLGLTMFVGFVTMFVPLAVNKNPKRSPLDLLMAVLWAAASIITVYGSVNLSNRLMLACDVKCEPVASSYVWRCGLATAGFNGLISILFVATWAAVAFKKAEVIAVVR
ncbi:hypothetical protein K432DRAFT_403445 [Lepidopterella palustris CBS 459.81]|uniref:MARVEL domain-containing protein n=1 Tax=Lepidopterella palustris CBS 459.81 TaxID=1314670 RepID=A0A8E2EDY6_9PEZI|nr:hypothetical protein K432DRAFT_403445 [Lepidopterella palustris CBS 459.81]